MEEIEYISIQQLTRGNTKNKVLLPLFLVQIPRFADHSQLFQVTKIMGLKVQFKKYKGCKGPQQCYYRQRFFHCVAVYWLRLQCVKCAGEHIPADCQK